MSDIPSSPDLSAMLGRVLSNPELLQGIASAIQSDVPQKEDAAESASIVDPSPSTAPALDSSSQSLPNLLSTMAPLLSTLSQKTSSATESHDPRTALLCALKPYLCASRCEAIDYLLKLEQITSVMRHLDEKR